MQSSDHWSWIVFGVAFGSLFAVDLLVHRHGKESSQKSAVFWSVVWVAAGLAFCGFVWATSGANRAENSWLHTPLKRA